MGKIGFRNLTADEIEVRIGQIKQDNSGLSLLLYKNARCDMALLDETFGPFGWQRSHESIDGRLYCTLSVRDPDTGEWVSKTDVGTESRTEAEKGAASDCFKRAAVNWGIGRALYSAPFVWVTADKCRINNGKCYDRFRVSEIGYSDDGSTITALEIVNDTTGGKVVYSMKGTKKAPARKTEPAPTGGTNVPPKPTVPPMPQNVPAPAATDTRKAGTLTPGQVNAIRNVCKNHGIPEEKIFALYRKNSLEELTAEDWQKWKNDGAAFIELWERTHTGAA